MTQVMTDTDRLGTTGRQPTTEQRKQAGRAGRLAGRSGVIRPSVISSERAGPKSGFALVGHRPPGAAFLEGLAPPVVDSPHALHSRWGIGSGVMSFFCFSAFCFCWAELAGSLLSSFFCPVLESIEHTLTLPHTHTLEHGPTSVASVAATRRHYRLTRDAA